MRILFIVLLLASFASVAPAQTKPQHKEIEQFEKDGGKVIYLGKIKDLDRWVLATREGRIRTVLNVTPQGVIIRGEIIGQEQPRYTFCGTKAITEGSKAPDFSETDLDGKSLSLKDFRGKWVLLYFYPRSSGHDSISQARGFQRDLPLFEKRNTIILGVSGDDGPTLDSFRKTEGLTFHLLPDEKNKISSAYCAIVEAGEMTLTTRKSFLIDPEGHIKRMFLRVDPATHSEAVLTALKVLQTKN